MSAVEQTAEETFDSLTGFDEIAIAQRFGQSVGELATSNPSMFGRALVFVVKRRDGANDEEAWNAAMTLSMKGFTEFFAEPSEEEAGKGEEREQQPGTSLSSVS